MDALDDFLADHSKSYAARFEGRPASTWLCTAGLILAPWRKELLKALADYELPSELRDVAELASIIVAWRPGKRMPAVPRLDRDGGRRMEALLEEESAWSNDLRAERVLLDSLLELVVVPSLRSGRPSGVAQLSSSVLYQTQFHWQVTDDPPFEDWLSERLRSEGLAAEVDRHVRCLASPAG